MIFGKNKLIAEQAKELAELKEKLAAAEKELGSYKEKEAAIARTMTDAALTAQNMITRAENESTELKQAAEKDVEALREQSSTIISDAEKKSAEIITEAEEQSEKKRKETEEEVRSYAGILVKLNENMKEQARLAEEASRKYAAFYEQMSRAMPGILGTSPAMLEASPEEKSGDVVTVSDITGGETDGETTTDDILDAIDTKQE